LQRQWEQDQVGQQRARDRNRPLSVAVAALLLFALAVPTLAAKLDALRLSELAFSIEAPDPVCVPFGYCFGVTGGSFERTGSTYRLPLRITGVDNVYQLAKELDECRLKLVVSGDAAGSPRIEPSYTLYINFDEAARQVGASLAFDRRPTGRISVAFERDGVAGKPFTLDIRKNDIGKLGSLVAATEPKHVRAALGIMILLIAAITSVLDAGAADRSMLGRPAFAGLTLLRLVAIVAAATIVSPTLHVLAVFVILMPWLAILSRWPASSRSATGGQLGATVSEWTAPLWRSDRAEHRITVLELGVLVLGLGIFAHMLCFGPSFRWSIFEERDFLEARQVLSKLVFPIYGPELLMGGHTIGGSLYLLLAPLVALWNDPEALRLLNQLLFLGMAMVLWWGLRDWVGPAGALFAVFALIASERIVALSYWPIHPNFSLFFAFLYAATILRGAVGGHRGLLIFSGLLRGILTQLHFSYFLLVLCHVLLVLFGNCQPDRWTKPLAIAAIFVPLGPFLLIDALQGFPNLAQILERPRLHGLYPNRLFGNVGLLPLIFGWVRQIGGPVSNFFSQLTMLLIGMGIAMGIASVAISKKSQRGSMTPAFAATILFCGPLFELTALGMGYNSRHTLATVPALFMLAGFGFAGIVGALRPARAWIATATILPLLAVVAARAVDAANMARIVQSEGEWAIDYKSREAIAMDMAVRLGVSPELYSKRTIWWWVGWSIDPAIYARIYGRSVPAGDQNSLLAPDQYVLVTDKAELPPFLDAVFDREGSRPVGGMHVHVATPKPKLASLLPSSNADTGVRLHPFLQEVDLIRHHKEGFVRIGQQQTDNTKRDLFLGLMARGRIKLLVATEQSHVGNRARLRWCVDSPSLNGHYQEFKTVWQPRLVLTPEHSAPMQANLAADVLGSLPFKAPRCGEVWSEQVGSWQVSFALEGLFDQSFMLRPDLTPRQWPLDFNAALQTGSLSQKATTEWLGSRFAP
jgi:hypothetical protein